MQEDNIKERRAAARIVGKHLRRLFVKAILKGYDLTRFGKFYLGQGEPPQGNPPPLLSYASIRTIDGEMCLEVNTSVAQVDISSTPELFSQARKAIDTIEAIVDSLPVQPRPLLNTKNLALLREMYLAIEASAGDEGRELFHSNFTEHANNGLKTMYLIQIDAVSEAGITGITWGNPAYGKPFSDCATAAIGILDNIEKTGCVDIDGYQTEILQFCNHALLVVRENRLLMELERNMGNGLAVELMLDSIRQDMEEVFPGVQELNDAYGDRVRHLPKAKQISLFQGMRVRQEENGEYPGLSGELPGVNAAIDVTLDRTLATMKGPFRSWDGVRKAMTSMEDAAIENVDFYIPLCSSGSGYSSQIGCHAYHSRRTALMCCLFVALNRAVEGGEDTDPGTATAYIRCVSRGVAEAAVNTFTSSLAEEHRQDFLDVVRGEPRKTTETAYNLADYKEAINGFGRALSGAINELKELRKLAGTRLNVETTKHFPISDGWYCSVYLEEYDLKLASVKLVHMEKDTLPSNSVYAHTSPPAVDLGRAAGPVILSRKVEEAVTPHVDKECVHRLLDFLSNSARVGKLLEDMSAFAGDVRRKSVENKERYYEVLQNDFPEDLMEEYATGTQNI